MASTPTSPPPPVNPDDRGIGPAIIGVMWTFTSIALIFIGLRFYVRVCIVKKLHVEDWIMLVSGVCILPMGSLPTYIK